MRARIMTLASLVLTLSCGQSDGTSMSPAASAGAGAGPSSTAVTGGAGTAATAGAGVPRAGTSAVGMAGRAASAGSRASSTSGGAGAMAAAGSGGSGVATAGRGAGSAGMLAAAGSGGGSGATLPANGMCDLSDPPADVKDWVDQSWEAQLGMNIKNRKAWNLDNVMLNKGTLNLCVRWGATTALPDQVRTNLTDTVARWFNDWFKGLGTYGCFPYPDGIKVNITGWAVRAGKESLLQGVDSSVPIYTETDGDGEPKCPDDCSSFVHWDHDFSKCMGGADKHSDYWLWFDDTLPGNQGAAAVGGDWGLRMPVKTFLDAFQKPSDHIVEHEMGHGFGIQDYYDWTGAKPTGGSIMIVGSTQSETPTKGDIWLLRRTWKEMKTMRGW